MPHLSITKHLMKGNEMKKGDVIKIYQDPYAHKDYEGEAKLVRRVNKDPEYERWDVRFLDDIARDGNRAETYLRVIVPA